MKAMAASNCLPWALPNSSPTKTVLYFGPSLGVPMTDPDTIDWFISISPFLWFYAKGFTNLNANDVLNPRSMRYFNECQRQPDLVEFLVDVILRTFDCWSNLISPSYTKPVRVEKSLNWNEKDRNLSLNLFILSSSSNLSLLTVVIRGPMLRSSCALVLGGRLMMWRDSYKKVWKNSPLDRRKKSLIVFKWAWRSAFTTTRCHNRLATHSLISSMIFENRITLNSEIFDIFMMASEKA